MDNFQKIILVVLLIVLCFLGYNVRKNVRETPQKQNSEISQVDESKDSEEVVKRQEKMDYLFPMIFLIFLIGICVREYRQKTPFKFIIVDKLGLIITYILTISLAEILRRFFHLEISIIFMIWIITVYTLIKRLFQIYINLRLFGYEKIFDYVADMKKKEIQEKIRGL